MAPPQVPTVRSLSVSNRGCLLLTVIVSTGFVCPIREERTPVTASIINRFLSLFLMDYCFKITIGGNSHFVIHAFPFHDQISGSFISNYYQSHNLMAFHFKT